MKKEGKGDQPGGWVRTVWLGGGYLTQERPRPGRLCDIISDEGIVITLAVTQPGHRSVKGDAWGGRDQSPLL